MSNDSHEYELLEYTSIASPIDTVNKTLSYDCLSSTDDEVNHSQRQRAKNMKQGWLSAGEFWAVNFCEVNKTVWTWWKEIVQLHHAPKDSMTIVELLPGKVSYWLLHFLNMFLTKIENCNEKRTKYALRLKLQY